MKQAGAFREADMAGLFVEAARQVDGAKIEGVGLDDEIGELGLDSVAMVEIVGYLEDAIDVLLPDSAIAEIKTLRDFACLISEELERVGADRPDTN